MNIKILDSWLREYLRTDANPKDFAKAMSLTSVSIERIEDFGKDKLYDIEITTNRPDLMSVVGIAREAAAVLPHFGYKATFTPPVILNPDLIEGIEVKDLKDSSPQAQNDKKVSIQLKNDPNLVNRVLAVVMDVEVGKSPKEIQDRLETSDIRSLNSVIDVTNYVMRTIGHPTHVFDFDRLNTKTLTIRESKKGETIKTLDKKEHTLQGGDVVAADDTGRIVDLLGVMGLENSVVTEKTKRILFFIDNVDPKRIRKTSMGLAIRTDAAQINEKDLDPELGKDALLYGIEMFKKIANGKVVSYVIDIYPNKPKEVKVSVSHQKIEDVIGVQISQEKIIKILSDLYFRPHVILANGVRQESKRKDPGQARMTNRVYECTVPTFRYKEITLEEDLIEEIARVYGFHNLPSVLPEITSPNTETIDVFFWENRIKDAMKYWGYTEVYTYSMVPSVLFEGPLNEAIRLRNPLDEDHVIMRKTLVPSLLQVLTENKTYDTIQIFEIANIYEKKGDKLPKETRTFAGVVKKPNAFFFEVKGLIEQICNDIGIENLTFRPISSGGLGADVLIGREYIGEIEILDDNLINFELDIEKITSHATLKKTFTPLAKYPPIIEDLSIVVSENVQTGDIIETIKSVNPLVREVTLLDKYQDTRTFHIVYQDKSRNLTTEEVTQVRNEIKKLLEKKCNASIK